MAEEIIESRSKRTTITVEMNKNTGIGVVLIDRDGQRIQRIDIPKEPVRKTGLGN